MLHKSLGIDLSSSTDIVVLCLAAAVGGAVLGILADAIMGRRGFGLLGNGILIDIGLGATFYALDQQVGGLQVTSLVGIAALEFLGATLVLLAGGVAKSALLG